VDTRARTITDYFETFTDTETGKRVLADLKASLDVPSYDRASDRHTAYNEGRRSVYLSILELIEAGRVLVENDGVIPGQQTTYRQEIDNFFGGDK
jgi:hypothetical protein